MSPQSPLPARRSQGASMLELNSQTPVASVRKRGLGHTEKRAKKIHICKESGGKVEFLRCHFLLLVFFWFVCLFVFVPQLSSNFNDWRSRFGGDGMLGSWRVLTLVRLD